MATSAQEGAAEISWTARADKVTKRSMGRKLNDRVMVAYESIPRCNFGVVSRMGIQTLKHMIYIYPFNCSLIVRGSSSGCCNARLMIMEVWK